jgi:hypothetical protein
MYRFASVAVIALIVVSACGTSEMSEPGIGGDASQIVIDSFAFAPPLMLLSERYTTNLTKRRLPI